LAASRVGHPRQAQLGHQAVLQGVPEALDAPLGLGRAGRDGEDAQLLQRPPELGGLRPASQLLLQAPGDLGVPLEDAMAVAIEVQGDALGAEDLTQQQEVAVGILLLAEDGGHDLARRIVDRSKQGAAGLIGPQPVVGTAVDLQQHPRLGHPIASPPVTWCPALANRGNASRAEDPTDAGTTEDEPLAQRQQFHQMAVVASGVGTTHQLHHPLPHRIGDPPRRGPPPIPVGQARRSLLRQRRLQPPHLALRQAQSLGRLRRRPPAGHHLPHYPRSLLLSFGQRSAVLSAPGPPGPGRTASPTRLTESLTS
jgi:hypothetical protein